MSKTRLTGLVLVAVENGRGRTALIVQAPAGGHQHTEDRRIHELCVPQVEHTRAVPRNGVVRCGRHDVNVAADHVRALITAHAGGYNRFVNSTFSV
jgi:hypothetical protein